MTQAEQQELTLKTIQAAAVEKMDIAERIAANFSNWLREHVQAAATEYNERHMPPPSEEEQQ